MKAVGLFNYHKWLDEDGIPVNCEVKVFPLLVKRQSETWPEFDQRLVQWIEPSKAVSLIREPELKELSRPSPSGSPGSEQNDFLKPADDAGQPDRPSPLSSAIWPASGRRSLRAPDRRRRQPDGR